MSLTEAEYKAFTQTTIEVAWIKSLLLELGLSFFTPPILWCDNQSVSSLAANLVYHACTEHIESFAYNVKEQVTNKPAVI